MDEKYFEPLRVALAEFLEELKELSLQGKLQIEEPRPLRFNNRQVQYDKSREETTKIDPQTVFCVGASSEGLVISRVSSSVQPPIVHLVNPERYRHQKAAEAMRATASSTVPSQKPKLRGQNHNIDVELSVGSVLSQWRP